MYMAAWENETKRWLNKTTTKKNMETGSTDQVDGRSGGRDGRVKTELGGCVPAGARADVGMNIKKIGKRSALPLIV